MPEVDIVNLAACALHNSASQLGEDLVLLPTLIHIARGRPGTFVEIGAYTGNSLSNTLTLERCFNWTGLLIEGNPDNFQQLLQSGRRGRKVHTAICDAGGNGVRMTRGGGPTAGDMAAMSTAYVKTWGRANGAAYNRTVDVPCNPMHSVMAGAGVRQADFLSLDVEGAEDVVIRTVRANRFKLVMAEADNYDPPKDERVAQKVHHAGRTALPSPLASIERTCARAQILSDGLRHAEQLKVRASNIFISPDEDEVLLHPVPPAYLPLQSFKIFKFRPSLAQLEQELKNVYRKLGCTPMPSLARRGSLMRCPGVDDMHSPAHTTRPTVGPSSG